ncbi:MAG: Rieske 2Fe-2S domain-containing protein [Chloroflexi bacterium]|nr:Rieske 2Fe-2S domain-containing protein [Chloroflexota bacterium]
MMAETIRDDKLTRRNFLLVLWGASTLGLSGQGLAALFQFLQPRVDAGGFGSKVVAGNLDEFRPGTVTYVQKSRCYISRLADGGMLALWQRCTHLGCTVPWREEQGQFLCPCHSSVFNRQGEVTGGPAPRPLDLFPLSVKDGKLLVDTSRPTERAAFERAQVFYPA